MEKLPDKKKAPKQYFVYILEKYKIKKESALLDELIEMVGSSAEDFAKIVKLFKQFKLYTKDQWNALYQIATHEFKYNAYEICKQFCDSLKLEEKIELLKAIADHNATYFSSDFQKAFKKCELTVQDILPIKDHVMKAKRAQQAAELSNFFELTQEEIDTIVEQVKNREVYMPYLDRDDAELQITNEKSRAAAKCLHYFGNKGKLNPEQRKMLIDAVMAISGGFGWRFFFRDDDDDPIILTDEERAPIEYEKDVWESKLLMKKLVES